MAITKGFKQLMEEANAEIVTISVEEAKELHNRGDVVMVDIRDIRELWREGKVPEAHHAPRGMLEFWVDPESPYHQKIFAQDDKQYVLY